MTGKQLLYEKNLITQRVLEIIQDYLYDNDESYACISMYFEKNNGENQIKVLRFGIPSNETPDSFRDSPAGFNDINDCCISLAEALYPRIVWEYWDGTSWDGKTLSQIRKDKN